MATVTTTTTIQTTVTTLPIVTQTTSVYVMPAGEPIKIGSYVDTTFVEFNVDNGTVTDDIFALSCDVIAFKFELVFKMSNITINYGDGTLQSELFTHFYKFPGQYTITIKYDLPNGHYIKEYIVNIKQYAVDRITVNNIVETQGFTNLETEEQTVDIGVIAQGVRSNAIKLNRINAWQSYDGDEYFAHLYSDNSLANYFSLNDY